MRLSDGCEVLRGQILLGLPSKEENLYPMFYHMYWTGEDVRIGQPGTDGFGSLLAGSVAEPEPPPIPARLVAIRESGPTQPQGRLIQTGVNSDLAIRGPGFFLVRSTNTDEVFATRAGAFRESPDGFLTTYDGQRVQVELEEQFIDLQLSRGNSQAEATGPAHTLVYWSVDWTGKVTVLFCDGTQFSRGKIVVQQFAHPGTLVRYTNGLYRIPPTAVPLAQLQPDRPTPPIQIIEGALELSQIEESLISERLKLAFHIQGTVTQTGNPADIGIVGNGFFLLRRPQDGKLYATRAGAFRLDEEGYLVTRAETIYPVAQAVTDSDNSESAFDRTVGGLRLQGFCDPGLSRVGDIRIDMEGLSVAANPETSLASWSIDYQGKIQINLSNGSNFVRGQVLLQEFTDPYALKYADQENENTHLVYSDLQSAQPKPSLTVPGEAGAGDLQNQAIESVVLDRRPLAHRTGPGPWFVITGIPAGYYLIEATSDLKTWSPFEVCALNDFGCGEISLARVREVPLEVGAGVGTVSPGIEIVPPKVFFRVVQLP